MSLDRSEKKAAVPYLRKEDRIAWLCSLTMPLLCLPGIPERLISRNMLQTVNGGSTMVEDRLRERHGRASVWPLQMGKTQRPLKVSEWPSSVVRSNDPWNVSVGFYVELVSSGLPIIPTC